MTSSRSRSSSAESTGSPNVGEPGFLAVGKLRRPHGVRGEMFLDILTDFPERLHPGMTLYLGPEYTPRRLRTRRWHGEALLVSFDQDDTPEAAGKWRNQTVFVTTADRPPLPEGEYYYHQVIGLQVVDEQEKIIGQVVDILSTGANDVYLVRRPDGREALIPAVDDFVKEIDLDKQVMRVTLIPGLIEP